MIFKKGVFQQGRGMGVGGAQLFSPKNFTFWDVEY